MDTPSLLTSISEGDFFDNSVHFLYIIETFDSRTGACLPAGRGFKLTAASKPRNGSLLTFPASDDAALRRKNMSRSLKKGPAVDEKLMKKVAARKPNAGAIKTWRRASSIAPEFVGY